MSFHRPTRLQLAAHEAGHAYAFAAAVPSEHPIAMGLAKDDAGNDWGWSKRRTLLTFGAEIDNCVASQRREAAAEIFIAVAGPLAEFRHRHRHRDGAAFIMHSNVDRFLVPDAFDTDGDFERIRSTMEVFEDADQMRTLHASIDAADVTLALNWPSIKRLARKLHDQEFLDYTDLLAWFADHPAKPCPMELRLIARP